MKKVLAGGRFNILHSGHRFFLKEAKKLGDYLIVVVANDETIKRHNKDLVSSQEDRKKSIENLGFVDKVVIGHPEDILKTVEAERPDIIALGYDQAHDENELRKKLHERGLECRVVRIQGLKGYKSSEILNKNKKEKVTQN